MKFFVFYFLFSLAWAQAGEVAARVKFLRAEPPVLKEPGWVTVSWSAAGVETILLDPIHDSFPAAGQVTSFVNARTIFWVHAYNARGGESRPLVVDLPGAAPEPSLPESPPALPLDPVPAPAPEPVPVPAPAPAPAPAHAPSRAAAARGGGFWIQFGAMNVPSNALGLQKSLRAAAGVETALAPADLPGGTRVTRVRMGPFQSRAEARERLRGLRPKVAAMGIKPIVCTD